MRVFIQVVLAIAIARGIAQGGKHDQLGQVAGLLFAISAIVASVFLWMI